MPTNSKQVMFTLQKEVLLYETQRFFWVDSRSILMMRFNTGVKKHSYPTCLYPRQCGP